MKSNINYNWACGYQCIVPFDNAIDEKCNCHDGPFPTLEKAISDALKNHNKHKCSIYIWSPTEGYIGLIVGLNFNSKK